MNIYPAFVFQEAEPLEYSLAKVLQCISVVWVLNKKKKKSSVHSCMVKLSSGDNKSNSLWILCVLLKREEKESFVHWHNAILSLNSSNLQTKYFVNCGNLVIT